MKLYVAFDDDLMKRYASRGASPLFTIYWSHEGEAYPSPDWLDFGAVILGWWLNAAIHLVRGKQEECFVFMDGPYELTIEREGEVLRITGREAALRWTVLLPELVSELIDAATKVGLHLYHLGIAKVDQAGLAVGVAQLRELMERRRMGGGRR